MDLIPPGSPKSEENALPKEVSSTIGASLGDPVDVASNISPRSNFASGSGGLSVGAKVVAVEGYGCAVYQNGNN